MLKLLDDELFQSKNEVLIHAQFDTITFSKLEVERV